MKLVNIIYKYLKYWFTAQRIHSIQSPFLYELATQVIRKKTANKSIEEIQHLRNKLSRSEKVINITDYGAGSNINPSTKRKIKDIVINSSKNSKFGILLYNIVSFYKPNNIVELGTSFGISTLYLSKAFNSAKVYSFEGCPETIKIAEHNIKEQKVKNVSSTIAAIIAINIDHPSDVSPEDFFINEIDWIKPAEPKDWSGYDPEKEIDIRAGWYSALEEEEPDFLGMSALLTTTMPYMKVVIDTLIEKGLRDKYLVLVGGAPLNEEFSKSIGADAYCRDAAVAVEMAKDLMKRKHNQLKPN